MDDMDGMNDGDDADADPDDSADVVVTVETSCGVIE